GGLPRPRRVELDRHHLARRPSERLGAEAEGGADLGRPLAGGEHGEQAPHLWDRRAACRHASSASGNERCSRGGTMKFCRCVVFSTALIPWPREPGGKASFVPSGSTPSIASRLRWKSSLVGLKTTKWTPAAGLLL